jgi:hypothetical protein
LFQAVQDLARYIRCFSLSSVVIYKLLFSGIKAIRSGSSGSADAACTSVSSLNCGNASHISKL